MTVEQTGPLRIGVIVDSFVQPRWVRKSLEKALATGLAKLALLVKVSGEKDESSLLFKLYNRIDRKLFAADALELVSIEDLFEPAAISNDIKAADLDVLVNFGPIELNAKFAAAAKQGVWFYSFGDAPGFSEVLNQTPITYS